MLHIVTDYHLDDILARKKMGIPWAQKVLDSWVLLERMRPTDATEVWRAANPT
jgi:hypothetical protein